MSDEKNKMLEVVKGIEDARAIVERVEAKGDKLGAELKEQVKKIDEDTAKKFEEVQKSDLAGKEEIKALKAEQEKFKADYADLYKKANRLGTDGTDTPEAAMFKRYSSEMDNFLRKGVEPSSEAIEEMSLYMAQKSMATQDEFKVKHEAANIRDQITASGHLVFAEKSMVTGINPDGGYLTQPDRRTDMSVRRIFETTPMRALANVITTTSGSVQVIIDDNESDSGGWTGEVSTRGDTDQAKIGLLEIMAHEQFAQPKASQKMLDDGSINIEAWLAAKTDDIIRRTENTAFVTGDGSQKPKGFLDYPAWTTNGTYERGKIEQIASGTSGIVKADGLVELQNSLIEEYQSNAAFLMKRATFGAVSKLKDGTGAYLLNSMILPEGVELTVLGKPVFFANDMPAIAVDSLSIAYGDFGVGYTIVDRMGIRVLRDPFTDKPFVKFYTTKRVGGAVTNYQSIKIQKLEA